MIITKDTFIIADTHFAHTNVLEYEPNRKVVLGDHPDERMAELWNQTVGKDDIVFHLGDFAFKSEAVRTWAQKLNGIKYLLRGNHDKSAQTYLDNGFAGVIDFPAKGEPAYHITDVDGARILFSHYPIVSDGFDDTHWRYLAKVFDREHCDINIHGHIHSMQLNEKFCINASVEAIGYAPVKLGEMLKKHDSIHAKK
ncbi:MAG: metallophosphoesterase family protein [Sulfuricurvum sp.]|nr:metallophosphoesterase family protein [Sulfuricurvum sp.]